MEADWVIALCNVIMVVGIIVAICQFRNGVKQSKLQAIGLEQVKKQLELASASMKNDHERTRRVNTVDVVRIWVERTNHLWSAAKKVAEKTSVAECTNISDNKSARIPIEVESNLRTALSSIWDDDKDLTIKDGFIEINTKESTELKYLIVSYLNALETVLMAWRMAIVDKEMIEKQFCFLVKLKTEEQAMKNYRQAVDGHETYPCIELFIDRLIEKYKDRDEKPPKEIAAYSE
ncbi:MAG: hypothetical protein HWE26_00250 [Alteromonadaceae bacterium]|nr:hypothetical protein [Alteromonadaceae bacterium]